MNTYEDLKSLANLDSVCLITHIEPDPDALASMIVLKNLIEKTFNIKRVDVFANNSGLKDNLKEILGETILNPEPTSYSASIMLDSPNAERLGTYKSLYEKSSLKIVIDHHATNNFSGNINIVEVCSSTCEIVYNLAKYFDHNLSNEEKGKLYAGLITDTNNFTVGEISKNSFNMAADITQNINREAIYKAFLANNTLKGMLLLSLAIQNLKSYDHNEIIITHITREKVEHMGAEHMDMCGIVNQIATINNAKLICFIEPRENCYYVSMRAKRDYDVSKIAKENGGGGHVGAAAFESYNNLNEIEELILSEFRKQLKTIKPKPISLFKSNK